ncbi:threonine--tRNA ligase [Haloglycomyces albus]|uniref:threonine--tRNA ligase n=1 Tax=Haloglycomyces albus TaxID=526067 RepID=UPI00046D33ED|nr:threonine--tRNA ligase [Haloglycomyces albus]
MASAHADVGSNVYEPLWVKAGTTCTDAVTDAGLPTRGNDAIVVVRDSDGQLRDLDWAPESEVKVEPVALNSPDGLNVMRHSAAHVLAQAVQELHEAKLGIGPPVTNGFYYDFDVAEPFTPDDLKQIEKRMLQIIKQGQTFRRRRFDSQEEARTELANEPFKLELIESKGSDIDAEEVMEVGDGELTSYDNLDPKSGDVVWSDLCRGPHLPTTKLIGAVKLMRVAAAYWMGSEKNPQLQRIYGTAWPSKAEQKEYLNRLAEAEKRDHRKLGAQLDLFSFPEEVGSGLPVFHPKGGLVRNIMEDYSRQKHIDGGYSFVNSPHVTKENLFQTSGHLDWYRDGMFPAMEMEGADYYLKPMNCPFHCLIFRSRGRSYRELPLRMFEFGSVYRYEKSGVIHGLTRVRGMTQDDAHIYTTKDKLAEELTGTLKFVLELLQDYGLDDFYLELSTKNPEKYVGDDAIWEEATQILADVAAASGLELVDDPGGAAFYGPKISVQAKDAIGRTWQMSTMQLDFNTPERFDLQYIAPDGSRQRPIMIHRALFGSIERFFGVLLEHYAGAFPAWLAPVQVQGIPVREENSDYLWDFVDQLRASGIRAEVDVSDDRMQKKVRNAQLQKIPFMVIAGDDDQNAGTVSFRYRDGSTWNGVPIAQAVEHVVEVVETRVNHGPSNAEAAAE